MGGVVKSVGQTIAPLLFGSDEPEIPKIEAPAAPAPKTRSETGADVVIGADASKNARTSNRTVKKNPGTMYSGSDVLGGLGKGGGLNI